jgi:integrase
VRRDWPGALFSDHGTVSRLAAARPVPWRPSTTQGCYKRRFESGAGHCNRHTSASRLVMAGVDLLSIQKLGGWRTRSMAQRYAHLALDNLRTAVERLTGAELGVNLDSTTSADTARVS